MTETSRQAAEFIMAAEFDSINSHYDKGSIKTKNFIFLISSEPSKSMIHGSLKQPY